MVCVDSAVTAIQISYVHSVVSFRETNGWSGSDRSPGHEIQGVDGVSNFFSSKFTSSDEKFQLGHVVIFIGHPGVVPSTRKGHTSIAWAVDLDIISWILSPSGCCRDSYGRSIHMVWLGGRGPVNDLWLVPHHSHKVCTENYCRSKSAFRNANYLDLFCSNTLALSK